MTSATERLDRDLLVEQAIATAGADDFGEPTWTEGLDHLLTSLRDEARLNDLGVEIATGEVVGYLATRLAITAWRAEHPEVAAGPVERPIVIVGQPRTGTTILYDLLAQDPRLRAPLTWEVDAPCPPPETATFATDPRIATSQATLELADSIIPGFTDFHPLGATLAQECVRITAGDFRSMIFPAQYRVPSYDRWLLHEADMAPAYRWHRRFLQHLQSRHPASRWLLKSPAHLWHLDALAGEYPDAVVVQTHRDPLKVIASVSALAAHLRRMASDETSVAEAADEYADDILVGLERGMAARDRNVFPAEQVVDVHFSSFLADPIGVIAGLYGRFELELTPEVADRMRAFLAAHPGDGGGGGTRYRFADTGLDAEELRERAAAYQERYAVESEPVT
ncbi:MAG: sulfotransferase [Actinomycetota bacterium]|nr:sulfotransferase [Acidimicrobiia bacterium]MDQ3294118.1 sulfotransferase [Actinomycetota bacterium]